MQWRGDSVRPKAKKTVLMGILGRKWLEKSDKQENGLNVLREDQWSWQLGC